MRIPPYWARSRYEGTDDTGHPRTVVACGWSFSSLHEAQTDAAARAQRVFEVFARGQEPERYEYHDRPIREEIIKEISDGDSHIAIITRNRYGALVLNCSHVLFVDVDFPKPAPTGLLEAMAMAFSRRRRDAKRDALIQESIQHVRDWAARNPPHGFRLYRTREGLRLLFTGQLYNPTSDETDRLLRELNADPLYMKLTQKQECFRARLTAKPWRCGCSRPPDTFPFDDAGASERFRQWEAAYTRHDAGFKVCEFIAEFGERADVTSVRTITDVHDKGTRIDSNAPLA